MSGLVVAVVALTAAVVACLFVVMAIALRIADRTAAMHAALVSAHAKERDTLLRAVLAKHGAEFGNLDRVQKDAHIREIQAFEQASNAHAETFDSQLGRHLAALVGDYEPDDRPLVPEGL